MPLASLAVLAGAMNFRDIGGLIAPNGRHVRHGIVYRSGELNTLTDSDLETLASLNIRYIYDLRTDAERAAAPTRWPQNPPSIVPIAVGFGPKDDPAYLMKPLFAKGFAPDDITNAMRAVTAKIALDGAPEIGQILHDLAQGQSPAIIHCTAGKDRTGVLIAILLTILGVDREQIYADYLQSNSVLSAQIGRLRSGAPTGIPSALAAMPLESFKILMGVDRTFLDAAITAATAKYGSFDAYISNGLKLTAADVEALRARLLE